VQVARFLFCVKIPKKYFRKGLAFYLIIHYDKRVVNMNHMEVVKMNEVKKVEHYLHAGNKSIYIGYTANMGAYLVEDFINDEHDEKYDLVLVARTLIEGNHHVYLYSLTFDSGETQWYVVNHLQGEYDDVVYPPLPRIHKYAEAVMHYNVAIVGLLGGL
jgi:hypothetical protein